jgi:hypothetical protein
MADGRAEDDVGRDGSWNRGVRVDEELGAPRAGGWVSKRMEGRLGEVPAMEALSSGVTSSWKRVVLRGAALRRAAWPAIEMLSSGKRMVDSAIGSGDSSRGVLWAIMRDILDHLGWKNLLS